MLLYVTAVGCSSILTDLDHYKVKVRDEAVMNHMAPNVESVVAEIHWFVQK